MKKFLIYFVIIFIGTFSFLNFRFVKARVDFWLNRQEIERNVAALENDLVASPTPTRTPLASQGPGHTPQPTPVPTVNVTTGFVLEVPSIGVTAPIVLEQSTDPDTIFNRLEDGVVHYADTPLPGEPGASVILGHSSAYPWYKGKYGSVFALLSRLQPGDKVIVRNGSTTLTYSVTGSIIFHPLSKDEKIDQFAQTDNSSIILVSCWPVGTDYKRIAVKADLIR